MVSRNHAKHTGVMIKVGPKPRKLVMESKCRKRFSFDSRMYIQPYYKYVLSTSGVPVLLWAIEILQRMKQSFFSWGAHNSRICSFDGLTIPYFRSSTPDASIMYQC